MRTVSTDEETREGEKTLLEKDPNINFSEVYRLAIATLLNKDPTKSLVDKRIKLKNDIAHLQADLQTLEEEIKENAASRALVEEKALAEESRIKQKRFDSQKEAFKVAFDLTESDADTLTEQYLDQREKGIPGWVDYGKSQGLLFNEEKYQEFINAAFNKRYD